MKKAILAGILFAALPLAGCKDPYGGASKASLDIAAAITAGMNTTSQLATAGTISKAEALNVLGYLEYANQGDEAFESCITTAHLGGNKPGSYTACAVAFNTALNDPAKLALIKVSVSKASQTISAVVNGLATGVAAVEATLGGA